MNRVILKNVLAQCSSSANKILEYSVNEQEVSVMNKIVKLHKM